MTPDCDRAAVAAAQILLERRISVAPIMPLPILKSMFPRVVVFTFAELAQDAGRSRRDVLSVFGPAQDAVTSCRVIRGEPRYLVAYNQQLPLVLLQRALARELGHIVLGHDGSRPADVRAEEALCFARHLLCPRPILAAIRAANVPMTVELVGNITGCFEHCIAGMQRTPGARVPAEINRKLREQFADYVSNFLEFQPFLASEDHSSLANFGSFMDNYVE